jgi:hypothetical protein
VLAGAAAWFSIRGLVVLFPAAGSRYVVELIGADTDCERTIRWLIAHSRV